MKWANLVLLGSVMVSTVSFAGSSFAGIKLDAKDVVRIEIGSDEDEGYNSNKGDKVSYLLQANKDLRRRVHRLEQALSQMQSQVYRLEESNSRPVVALNTAPVNSYTCYIKTTFKGTQIGKGSSETEARANAMKACDDVGGGFSCEDANVKCGN